MKALIFSHIGTPKMVYLGKVEEGYEEPLKTESGSFAIAEIIDDTLQPYTSESILKAYGEIYVKFESGKLAHREGEPLLDYLKFYNGDLHKYCEDHDTATAHMMRILDLVKVSPMEFLAHALKDVS